MLRVHQWAEERADRRADGAVARIFQHRHAGRLRCSPSSRSAPPPRRSTSSTTSSTWRSTAGTRPSATGPSPAACCRFRSAWRRSAVLLAISFAAAAVPAAAVLGVLAAYLVATTAYSLSVKRMLLLDVLTLAGLYTMRILAGAAATGIDVSFWLLAFAIFFFLSLALVKRYVELRSSDAGRRRAHRRARLSRRGPGDHRAGRHGLGLLVGAGAGALHRQRRGARNSTRIRGWCGRWRRSCSISPCASGSWRGATRCMTIRSSSSSATGAASWSILFGARPARWRRLVLMSDAALRELRPGVRRRRRASIRRPRRSSV